MFLFKKPFRFPAYLIYLKVHSIYANEPEHDKTNKMTSAPSEVWASAQSDHSLHDCMLCALWVAKDTRYFHGRYPD